MIRDKLLDLLVEICGTEEVKLNPDIEIFKEGLLDSFGTVELFVAIQEHLGIEVGLTEVDRDMWATPNMIIDYLGKRSS